MRLKELADLLTIAELQGEMDIGITGIRMNSQHVRQGDLFICIPGIPGFQEDRHQYAADAVRRGAVALVVEQEVGLDMPTIRVPDARYAMALFAAHLNGYPSHGLQLIGVTGTNGKTTTCHMIESIFIHAGHPTGLMGNLGTRIGTTLMETEINTQEPPELQANLKRMTDARVKYCFMEVSSQGLHMGRVLGCEFRTAVFTNLTQDHLDYHGSMDNYMAAKGLLFARLAQSFVPDPAKRKYAVLNADEEASAVFRKLTAAQVLTYGIRNQADVMAKNIRLTSQGTSFDLVSYAGTVTIQLRLVGTFNVYNALGFILLGYRVPTIAKQKHPMEPHAFHGSLRCLVGGLLRDPNLHHQKSILIEVQSIRRNLMVHSKVPTTYILIVSLASVFTLMDDSISITAGYSVDHTTECFEIRNGI
ncbi:Mur ligase family protein [Paenibacillus spongiae]|uniref:UDP-N-acetylmuramoyl-L-alanyl-D-glutamate--2, 6-diaminopimelate ligase n=1 Tax=Paenibacillus spongiae TaxID=2909671 RepID=A0ABY5SG83_9BACL|nr:UDP-N-acetylmuramoyl-L-alanyl-D-glutamate--2,6-diaminopimelate ligase [Paenibacillus spongiae]UVI32987.1 UDP-N-acetylmuramoyl-L-alanyl-D-glutamate--2,6-diaminopimelate ligase [Paenibacillus spongiae]